MTADPFAAPAAAGAGIVWADHNGELALIAVHSIEVGIKTAFGDNDAIRADVTFLDGPTKGETYSDTLIFPKVLISQLRSRVGQKVLGRLGQGNAKSGQSAPWLLQEASEADKKIGIAYLNNQLTSAEPPF